MKDLLKKPVTVFHLLAALAVVMTQAAVIQSVQTAQLLEAMYTVAESSINHRTDIAKLILDIPLEEEK